MNNANLASVLKSDLDFISMWLVKRDILTNHMSKISVNIMTFAMERSAFTH